MSTRHETLPLPHLPEYVFGERLGAGTYGTVYKARLISAIQGRPSSAASVRPISARSPTFYAIKCINRKALTKTTEDLLINEIKILKQIKHENIVEMYDFHWDEDYIYIIMEYCAGGDMSMFIRSRQKLSEGHARPFVQQIAKVLKFLYEKKISHMDLKPENILLTSVERPVLKVADFGVAQHIDKQGSRSIRGTLMYMAPEILSSEPYDNRVDLWSIGVILYECLFGRPPFPFISMEDLIYQIRSSNPIDIPNDTRISTNCRNLLEGLLQRDPNRRISFQDFFRHPFIFNDLSVPLAHADELYQRSLSYEQTNDFQKALDCRVQALDEYVALIKIDDDAHRKRMLKTKVNQGVISAENLKKRMKEISPSPNSSFEARSSLLPSPTLTPHDDHVFNNDKILFDAYQHCLNGNQLMNDFHFSQAIGEYETGLHVMFQAVREVSDPAKIKILHNMISHYLTKAETCKKRLESQRLDIAIAKIKEDADVNESANAEELVNTEEKKNHSLSPQNCHLQ